MKISNAMFVQNFLFGISEADLFYNGLGAEASAEAIADML